MEYGQYIDASPSFWNDDDNVENFVKRLSLYATIRAADIEGLVGSGRTKTRGQNITSKGCGLSLQNLFSGIGCSQFQQQYVRDVQTPSIFEDEEQASSPEDIGDHEIESSLKVNGSDIQDIPVEYDIKGLRHNEFPVIGFYVDRRICPGYRYKVRYIASDDSVFDDSPRILMSIGMGYGKRLTFKGDKLNVNDCVFWSDSHQDGYAFSLMVVQKGDLFVLYNAMHLPIADIIIESTDSPQVEESTTAENGTVRKLVHVQFACSITYHNRLHGNLLEIKNQDVEVLKGIAEVVKPRKEREAQVVCIKKIYVPRAGECTMWRE